MSKSKTKPGRLTAEEKLEILDLYAKGGTQAEIAEQVGRAIGTVAKAIKEMQDTTMKAFNRTEIPENYSIEPTNYIDTDVYARVLNRLIQAGITPEFARKRIGKICGTAASNEIDSITEEQLFEAAMQTISASEIFQQHTASQNKGVTIYTEAASQRGDDLHKSNTSNGVRPNGVTTFPTNA